MERKRLLGHMAAVLCVSMWGFAYVPIVVLLRSFAPFEILFFRIGLATVILYLIYPKRMGKMTVRQELLLAGAGLSGVTFFFLLQDFALLATAASNVSVISAISPMFTALLTWWILAGDRPTTSFYLGALLALTGIGLISFAGSRLELGPMGDLLALLKAFSWAIYSIFTKKIAAFGYHTIQTTRRVFLYGLLFLVPVLIFSDFRLGLARFAETENLVSMLFLGMVPSALCFALWGFSIKQLGPVRTSVYVYLAPLVAVLASVLILGEIITWVSGLGIVFTLGGLVISNWRSQRQAAALAK